MPPKINAARLRAFHAVAREGSFTAAARALHLTQPTLSAQVKSLEDAHGVQLFDRVGRGVALTAIGRSLLEITSRLAGLEEQARDLLDSAGGLRAGALRVGADGPHHVIPLLAAFARAYPGVEVSLAMGNSERVLRGVLESRSDVAVVAEPGEDHRIHAVALRTSPLVIFVPRGHPWSGRRSVRLAEISGERMILREAASATRRIFEGALERAGVRPQSVMRIESREAVREAVAAGLGIGVVSEAELDPDPRIRALPLRDARLRITEYVVCLQERRRLGAVRAFYEIAG